MEKMSETMALSAMNDGAFWNLDKFDGTNFMRWKDNIRWMLMALNISYVLDPNLQPIPEPHDADTEQIIANRKKSEDDELMCRGHILNTLLNWLYNLFSTTHLQGKYGMLLKRSIHRRKKGTKKFIMFKFYEFTMTDGKSIVDQVQDLLLLITKLREVKIIVPDALQVGAIMSKLPPDWNKYRKQLLHMAEDISLQDLLKGIQIEEETRK
ncbi:uncharacterized protein [Malus domestica]|uniref:uncharacterized protein n=1 Tax=Malus domestica TaxID=3750 RepID=UPI003975FDD6